MHDALVDDNVSAVKFIISISTYNFLVQLLISTKFACTFSVKVSLTVGQGATLLPCLNSKHASVKYLLQMLVAFQGVEMSKYHLELYNQVEAKYRMTELV